MIDGYREFMGVLYHLSATNEGRQDWKGEANVRIKIGEEVSERIVETPTGFSSSSGAMTGAEEMLKAFALTGALRVVMPEAFN